MASDSDSEDFQDAHQELEEYEDAYEELPECKICRQSDVELMEQRVCDCTGSVANYCFDCIRQSILHRDQGAPQDALGWPVCLDCHGSFRNIDYQLRQNSWSFREYLYVTRGWESREMFMMFVRPTAYIGAVTFGEFTLPPPDNPDWQHYRRVAWMVGAAGLAVFGYFGQSIYLIVLYYQYVNRPETEIADVLPAIEPPKHSKQN